MPLATTDRIYAQVVAICVSVMLTSAGTLSAQERENTDVISNWIGYSDSKDAVYHDLAGQAAVLLKKRRDTMASLQSLSDWQERQRRTKKTLLDIFGPLPEKTPLQATILRVIKKKKYRVEHIVYQSQPGFYVTSSLYIPNELTKNSRSPAILYCSGHSEIGYREPVYQQAILNLVNKGFIILAFDPVDQGERLEYADSAVANPVFGESDKMHSYSGAQLFLSGNSLAKWMIWDGIRAIDYLVSRPEVDPDRIGITGRSGGGTQSAYMAAIDERIAVSVPECYITSFDRLIASSGPQDAEQDPWQAIARGIDPADLLEVRAPKPGLVISTTRDQIFPIQGAVETVAEVSRIYRAYGRADGLRFVTDDAPHASTKKNRESMYAFFQRHLQNPGDSTDQAITPLTKEELRVTKTGRVGTSYRGETIFSLGKRYTDSIIENRSTKKFDAHTLIDAARRLSGFHDPGDSVRPAFAGRFIKSGYTIEKYFIPGDGNYVIPYLLMTPDHPNHRAVLYLDPLGKAVVNDTTRNIDWFVKKGFTVLIPDMPGTGELGPGSFRGDSFINGVSYNTWFLSMLIGRSLTGIQSADLVRLGRILKTVHHCDEVSGLASGVLGVVLLHAAAFDQAFSGIGLIDYLSSFRSLTSSRFYDSRFVSVAVPGALTEYDLPELAAARAPARLMLLNPLNGTGKKIGTAELEKNLSPIREAYRSKRQEDKLQVGEVDALHDLESYLDIFLQ